MKKITISVEDEVKFEIKRQAQAEGRSFQNFLRRFLFNHFHVSSPSPSATTSSGPVVVVPYTGLEKPQLTGAIEASLPPHA